MLRVKLGIKSQQMLPLVQTPDEKIFILATQNSYSCGVILDNNINVFGNVFNDL